MIRTISRITPPIRNASSKDIPDLHVNNCSANYATKQTAALAVFQRHPLIYCGFLAFLGDSLYLSSYRYSHLSLLAPVAREFLSVRPGACPEQLVCRAHLPAFFSFVQQIFLLYLKSRTVGSDVGLAESCSVYRRPPRRA